MLLAAILMLSSGGCQQAGKKPAPSPVKKAPEVAKYSQEPTISLYRSHSAKKENIQLEKYLEGVVAAEIGPKFPLEALKAQAIVARTMTLALMEYENGTQSKHGTDASDDHTEFQAYNPAKITQNISQAVTETRGQVLTYKGKFIYALFHSTCKNKTASIEEGFPNLKNKADDYLKPVRTDGLKNAPAKYCNWTVKIPRQEVKKIMGNEAGSLNDIRISRKGASGYALTISAGQTSISAVDLREKIGFDRLYSTRFSSVKAVGNHIVFKGNGWGHGVGMEQWGAYTMAKDERKTAAEIVAHYFPGSQLTKLYD